MVPAPGVAFKASTCTRTVERRGPGAVGAEGRSDPLNHSPRRWQAGAVRDREFELGHARYAEVAVAQTKNGTA